MNEKDNESNAAALDSLLNFETVKYFTAEQHELQRYSRSLAEYFAAAVQNQISLSLLNMGQGLIIGVSNRQQQTCFLFTRSFRLVCLCRCFSARELYQTAK